MSAGVPVLNRPMIRDGDCLKAAMWMLGNGAGIGRGLDLRGPSIVQHKKWIDLRFNSVGREQVTDVKTVPNPMRGSAFVNAQHFLHFRHFCLPNLGSRALITK